MTSTETTGYEASVPRRAADAMIMLDMLKSLRNKDISPEDRVLDIGCGPPCMTKTLWETSGASLVGNDLIDFGQDPFWDRQKSGRIFVHDGFLNCTAEQLLPPFDVVWCSFAAHHITAEGERGEKVEAFFKKVSSLLTDDGFFLCQIPAVSNFFPLIADFGNRVLQSLPGGNTVFQKYNEARAWFYNFWDGEPATFAQRSNLSLDLDLAMYSWNRATVESLFNTWWTANLRILNHLGILDKKARLQEQWCSGRSAGTIRIGYVHSRILIFHKSLSASWVQPKATEDSISISLVMDCAKAARSEDTQRNQPPQDERTVTETFDGAEQDLQKALTPFLKQNEPVLGTLALHEELKDSIVYVMHLRDKVNDLAAARRMLFANKTFEDANKKITDTKPTAEGSLRIGPHMGTLLHDKHCYAVCCWFLENDEFANHVKDLISQEYVVHLFCRQNREYVDNSLDAPLFLIMAKEKSLLDLFGTSHTSGPDAIQILNYFNWHLLSLTPQLLLIANVSPEEESSSIHSLVLSMLLSGREQLSVYDVERLVSALNIAALHLKEEGRWVHGDERQNSALEFYRHPYSKATAWPKCWEHTSIVENMNAINRNLKTLCCSNHELSADELKALFMSKDGQWCHRNTRIEKPIMEVSLKYILLGLQIVASEYHYDLLDGKFFTPMIPSWPFFVAMRMFWEKCKNDDKGPIAWNTMSFRTYKAEDGLFHSEIEIILSCSNTEIAEIICRDPTVHHQGMTGFLDRLRYARCELLDISEPWCRLFCGYTEDDNSCPILKATGQGSTLTLAWDLGGGA